MAGSWKRFPLRWPFWVPLAISFLFFGWRSSWFNLIPENVLGRSLYTNIQFNKITRFWSRQWKSVTHLSRLYMPHVRWHRILDSKQTYTTPVTIANLLLLFGHLFHTHRIHGWFVYLLLVDFRVNVVNPMEYDNTTFSLQTYMLILPVSIFMFAVKALPFVALWPHLWFPRQRLSFDPPSAKGPGQTGDMNNCPGRRGFSPPILVTSSSRKTAARRCVETPICLIGICCKQCQLRDFIYQVFATNVRISDHRITVTILEDSEVL